MIKYIYLFFAMTTGFLLVGCSANEESVPEERERPASSSILDELNEIYENDSGTEYEVSYWFTNTIIEFENISHLDFCDGSFEGDELVATCKENLSNIFPSDFGSLTVESTNSTTNSSGTIDNYEIVTKYGDGTNAYIFLFSVNSETVMITSFTYNAF